MGQILQQSLSLQHKVQAIVISILSSGNCTHIKGYPTGVHNAIGGQLFICVAFTVKFTQHIRQQVAQRHLLRSYAANVKIPIGIGNFIGFRRNIYQALLLATLFNLTNGLHIATDIAALENGNSSSSLFAIRLGLQTMQLSTFKGILLQLFLAHTSLNLSHFSSSLGLVSFLLARLGQQAHNNLVSVIQQVIFDKTFVKIRL